MSRGYKVTDVSWRVNEEPAKIMRMGDEPYQATDTVPGVRLLRAIWDIPKEKPPRVVAPENVSTNIYDTRSRPREIPRRRQPDHL